MDRTYDAVIGEVSEGMEAIVFSLRFKRPYGLAAVDFKRRLIENATYRG
jgi:hypothetical protein